MSYRRPVAEPNIRITHAFIFDEHPKKRKATIQSVYATNVPEHIVLRSFTSRRTVHNY